MNISYTTAVTPLRLAVVVAVIAAALGLGLGNAWATLHEQWTSLYGPTAHGYLVLAMGVWIAVKDWQKQPPTEFSPAILALLGFAACVAALTLMEFMHIDSTRLVLLPPLFLCAVSATLGVPVGRRLFWGAMFVYFALPQWWVINGSLQDLTIIVVSSVVHWTGVPAYIQGSVVQIPAGVFEIADGCSGLNYLLAGLSLVSFVALTQLDSLKYRAFLIGTAAAGAVLFNWLRVYLVILVGHTTDMQHYLVRVEHHTFGWILFLVFLAPIILLASRLEQPGSAMPEDVCGARVAGAQRNPGVPWSSVWMMLPLVLVSLVPRLIAWRG